MKMSKVKGCNVSECAYNLNNHCHAMAITIGDDDHPRCDTFCSTCTGQVDEECLASVGACKVSSCQFNEGLECTADEISVGFDSEKNEVDCLSYQKR